MFWAVTSQHITRVVTALFFAIPFALVAFQPAYAEQKNASINTVEISGGSFTPLFGFGKKEKKPYQVSTFRIDKYPVTRKQFLDFTRHEPQWSKKSVDPTFADNNYLKILDSSDFPATYVSWFAAHAYCAAKGGRLPTVLEWEYVAAASETKNNASRDPEYVERILNWYAKPASNHGKRKVGLSAPNYYGLYDLHGLIWEWTEDFNSVFVSGDNRQDGDKSTEAVCGAGATDASTRADYAAFMRYAMRSSVEAHFSQQNIGFRCAYDRGQP